MRFADEPRHAPYDAALARRLLAFLGPYRRHVGVAVGLLLALAGTQAAQPIVIKVAIDRHIASGDLDGLATVALAYLALLIIEFGLGFARSYLTTWIGQRAMDDLRRRLFGHLQRLPVRFFDKTPAGRLVTRLTSDVEVLNDLFSSGLVAVLGDFFMLTAIAAAMVWLDVELALAAFAVLPLVAFTSLKFRRLVRDAYREIRVRLARMNAWLAERVTGLEVVQLFRREEVSRNAFGALNRDHKDVQLESIHYYALFYPIVELSSTVAVALVVWYGGGEVIRGTLSFGVLVAFLEYARKFYRPIRDLAEKYNLLQAAMASGERLAALLDEPEDEAPEPGRAGRLPAPAGRVAFEDVWFAYEPNQWVLKGISLSIEPGERVAIVGATGAGKSTVASLLCRFYRPTSGRILLDGVDLDRYLPAELRARVGLVLQDVFLFSASVRDNVGVGSPRVGRPAVDDALRAVGADRFVDSLPAGGDTRVGERGRALSTGQKQLVAFARALAFDPPVLVLDEATSSVDTATEALIEEALGRLLEERTALVIAHRLSTIRNADRIVVLDDGEVRESGTHAELLREGGLYDRLHRLQLAETTGLGDPVADDLAGVGRSR